MNPTSPRPPQPPPPPPVAPRFTAERRWKEHLPEAAAVIGTGLVGLASAGLVTSSWTALEHGTQALLMAMAAAGLTVAGLWFERLGRRGLDLVIGLVLASATTLVAASATLAAASAVPGRGRVAIALGGAAALVHAMALLQRRQESTAQHLAAWGAALYAIGPPGTALSDRFDAGSWEWIASPIAGFFDPTVTSDVHLLTGIGHLLLGAALLAALPVARGRGAIALRVMGTVTVGFAALELNVLSNPLGAVAALGVVIGYLLFGIAREDLALVIAGVSGGLAAGTRVLVAVFSGKVIATMAVLLGGVALLAWALRAMRTRQDEDAPSTQI